MTKEEVIVAIRDCEARLGHSPSVPELQVTKGISRSSIRQAFGTYKAALHASGVYRHGPGYAVSMKTLFVDWAGVVRSLGKIPTMAEYEQHSEYSARPLIRHYGGWKHVPTGLLEWARKESPEGEWTDVLDVMATRLQLMSGHGRTSGLASGMPTRPRILMDRPIYGSPLVRAPLTYAPTNEAGVIFLFGTMARDLGYAVMRVQTEFPDCEAMREVELNRWQRVRIEFEYESRNFLTHMHPAAECDVIVCWTHNWQDCPLEVLELSKAIRLETLIGDPQLAADLRR